MRLEILNRGYRPGTKVLFALIRVFSGHRYQTPPSWSSTGPASTAIGRRRSPTR